MNLVCSVDMNQSGNFALTETLGTTVFWHQRIQWNYFQTLTRIIRVFNKLPSTSRGNYNTNRHFQCSSLTCRQEPNSLNGFSTNTIGAHRPLKLCISRLVIVLGVKVLTADLVLFNTPNLKNGKYDVKFYGDESV